MINISQIILASQSQARQQMLKKAGIDLIAKPANVNEEKIKTSLLNQNRTPLDISQALAHAKSIFISQINIEALVIGADQILECEGKIFNKPKDREALPDHILELSGKKHSLHSSISVAYGNQEIWSYSDSADLFMRYLTPAQAMRYAQKNPQAISSVGGYQIEGDGLHLFDDIKGDYHTILGMPLVPLLKFLRNHGYDIFR